MRSLVERWRRAMTPRATKRPDQPRVPIPPDIHTFQPEQPATVSAAVFAQTLREAQRGAAPGLSGARAEHFKLLLGDADGLELLAHAASARQPPLPRSPWPA